MIRRVHPTQRYWFPAKKFGWGWGPPNTWQGWLVLAAYASAVVAAAVVLAERRTAALAAVLAATSLLLWVCLRKGEPTRWRWGRR